MKKIRTFFERQRKKRKACERGAIVVEATIALTSYIFAIFIVLSLVDISYVQAKMQIALNAAAKEMSQYSYLYTTLDMQDHFSGSGGKSSDIMNSFSEVLETLSNGTANISDELSGMFGNASGVAAGDSAAEYIKDGLGSTLAKQLIKKNLRSYEGDTAEAFLERCRVKNGLSGLNFAYTSFLTDVNQSEVDLVVTYKVEVIKLLNMDYEFTFVQRARTKAWGPGVTLKTQGAEESVSGEGDAEEKNEPSIWDAGDLSRGDTIISKEKKNFEYTSSKNGFHAYNTSSNEFIRIRSLDTFENTYSCEEAQKNIKNTLNSTFNTLYSGVAGLDETVKVADSTGKNTTVKSDPDTRTYKIVVVIPEGGDINTVKAAAKQLEEEKKELGYNLKVEIKTGYGTPTPKTESGS